MLNEGDMMKVPDATVDFPFDFNYIPLKLQPDLWNEEKALSHRLLRFLGLYTISFAVGAALIFFPIGLFTGTAKVPLFLWMISSISGGGIIGFLGWWTFGREVKKQMTIKKSVVAKPEP